MSEQDQQAVEAQPAEVPAATAAPEPGSAQAALAEKIADLRAETSEPASETPQPEPEPEPQAASEPQQEAATAEATPTAATAEPEPTPKFVVPAEPPAEGYNAETGVFVKTYALGVDLSAIAPDELAEHPVVAPQAEDTARQAVSAGYRPAGAADLIDARPDGAKTKVTFAVPVVRP